VLQVAARKDEDDDPIPNGGMALDLTAELGGLVQEAPPSAEINNTTESQATNQTTTTTSQQCRNLNVPRQKSDT
jgi:hypothetical protein